MNNHVKEAGFGKRLLAYLIDATSVILFTVIIYNNVTSRFLFPALGGDQATDEMYSFGVDSHLLRPTYSTDNSSSITSVAVYSYADMKGDSSAPSDQTQAGYAEYFDRVWYYYTNFIPNDSRANKMTISTTVGTTTTTTPFTENDYYTYVEVTLLGLPASPEKITDVSVEENLYKDANATSKYFKYALNDAGTAVDIKKKPVLQAVYQASVDSSTANVLANLSTYFYSSSGTNGDYGLYGNAIVDMEGGTSSSASLQTYYSSRYSKVNYEIWLCSLVAFLPFQLAFFLIIPLCMKRGQTLGKLAMGLAVVKADGFMVTIKEKLLRQFFLTLLGSLVLLPWTMTGVMIYVLIAIVDYMILVMSKTHQSLHDRLAKTIVVSVKESLFFKDEAAMAEYASTHPEQFPELKNTANDAENTRIAQEDSILDLSTMNKNREEASKMTSFDNYEKTKEGENANKTPVNQPAVNLTKDETPDEEKPDDQAMKDLAALEGGTPDENGEVKPESPKEDTLAKPNEEGFTDDTSSKPK